MSAGTGSKESHGPPKKVHQEMVTPYKLTVAVLIKCYCQFKESGKNVTSNTKSILSYF